MHKSKFHPKKTPVSWAENMDDGVPPKILIAVECKDAFHKCDFFFLSHTKDKGPKAQGVFLVKREWCDQGLVQYHCSYANYNFVKDLVVAFAEKCLHKLDIKKITNEGFDFFAA